MTDAELLTQIELAITNHPGVRVAQHADRRVEYPDLADLISQRDELKATTSSAFAFRTYAKNGGGG